MSYAVSDTEGDHTLIVATDFIQSEVILGSKAIEVRAMYYPYIPFLNNRMIIVIGSFF